MTYDRTVTEKGTGDRGIFERAAMYMPGYRGYRDRNLRREMDKEVRAEVARTIKNSGEALANVHRSVVRAGKDLDLAKDIDRIRVKVDTCMKKIESAEEGYSGLWEAIKTEGEELSSVVEWDAKLLEETAKLRDGTRMLKDDPGRHAPEIESLVDDMLEDLRERKKVLKGLSKGGD